MTDIFVIATLTDAKMLSKELETEAVALNAPARRNSTDSIDV